MAKPRRTKNKDNARRSKKKVSILTQEGIEYVDWKDVNLLRRFVSDRAKVRARRVTGNSAQQQREIAIAIKNAREMALLPYASRVTTQRGGGRRQAEGGRADGPPPRPTAPPPQRTGDDEPDDRGDGSTATVEAPVAEAPVAEAPVVEAPVAESAAEPTTDTTAAGEA